MSKKPWYNDYDSIQIKNWVCPACKKEIPPGIVGISKHWSECGGKAFHDDLMKLEKNNKLTLKNVEKLIKKHENNNNNTL